MAENYDPNDPESVRRYVEEQTKVQSKLTADTNRFGRAMNTAFSGAGTAALSFASAVGSAEKGFSKYNSVVRDITNTIGELTSEFGIFGKSIGAAAKATGIMIEQVFAQTDRMSKGFDEIADIGAQAHFTAGALRGLSEAAGGSTFQMQAVGKAAKTAGSAFINVGDSVGTGMQKFGDIVTKNMTGFRKLGFTFEEVFEYTGKYLQQANALGVNLNRPVADLRKSSEAYMKNLVILADLTGADIKQQQQAIDLAASQENFRMKGLLLEKQLQEAKLRGDTANEAKIQKQIDGMLALSQGIARFDKDTQIAMLQSFASGGKVMSEQAAKLLIGGFDINKFGRAFDEGAEATTIVAQMLDDNAQAIKTTTERYGYAIASLNSAGQELAKTTGTSVERMTLASERNVFGQQKSAQKSLEAAEAGVEAQMGTRDALMAGVANMEQMERNVQRKIDEVVDKFNPFNSSMEDAIKSFKILAAAAFAATYAMGIMTSAQARRNPFSNENDRYGRRTIPGTGGIVGPGSAASAPWVRVANLMDICNCVGGGAAMPLGSQGMNKAQQKQYRRMRAQGVSEAQARGRILGAGGVGAGSLPGTGGIVAPVPVAPSVDAQPSRMARIGAAVKDRAGHMMTVGGHAGAAMIGGYALSEGANLAQSLGLVGEQGASGMKVAGGIASSAAQYAMLGSIFGPIGTGIGAVAGGLMGVVENYDSIKGFFSDSNEAAEKSKDATEAATLASEALAESRNRTEEFLREAIAANTEATRQNTTVTTTAGGAPTTGGEAGAEGEKPKMSVEDVEKGFADRQAEMAAEFMAKHQAVFQGWNTNDTKELERLEATAKSIKEKYTVERDAIVNTMYGAHVIKERVIEDEAAKKSLDELTAKINHMKEMRTKRSQTLAALEAEYRKNTADLEEQRRTLQITRENVAVINEATDERLKALAELLNGPMLAGTGAGSTTPGAPMPQGGKGNYTAEDLARQGLKTRGYGDVQEPGAVLNNRLIDLSKNIQENVPGFKYFSGFNDKWHKTSNPNSKHVRGEAVDFTLNYHPDRQQGADLVKQLKAMGFSYAQDEYNNPSSHATGKHMHAQLEKGGIVDGPKSGFPVEMHGREVVTPLVPNSILEQLGKTMGNFTNIKNDRSSETDTRAFENLSSALTTNIEKSLGSFTEKFTAPEFSSEMLNQLSLSDKILEKFDTLNQNKEDKTIDIESVNRQIADKVESAMKSLGEQNSQVAGEYILRLERVIDILESSHSTQEKLLRSTRT